MLLSWNILVISTMWLSCHFFFFFFRDISEDLEAIKLIKGFLLHLSGRDTFGLQLGKPISFRVLFLFPGDKLLMKHSNIMGHCVVKAVTHKHDLLGNAPPHPPPHPDRGRACPSLITAAHIAVASTSNQPPDILHLKWPNFYWTTGSKC